MPDDDNSAIAALQRVAARRPQEAGTAIEESRGSRANPNPLVFLDDATLNAMATAGNLDAARELRLRAGYAGPRGNAMAAQQASQGGFPSDGPRTSVPDQILRTSEPYGPWRSSAQIDQVLRMNPVSPDERARVGFPLWGAAYDRGGPGERQR